MMANVDNDVDGRRKPTNNDSGNGSDGPHYNQFQAFNIRRMETNFDSTESNNIKIILKQKRPFSKHISFTSIGFICSLR